MQAIRAALERKGLEVDADRGDGLSVWMLLMLRVSCHVLPLSSVLYPHDDTAFSATDMVQVLCCLSAPVAFNGTFMLLHASVGREAKSPRKNCVKFPYHHG